MVTEYNSLDERCLTVYEHDMVNGGKALIFKVYCVKRNNGMWELPAPQIFNENVYNSNKAAYDNVIQAFRNDCTGSVDENTSIILTEIETLKSTNDTIMLAIADLANSVVYKDEGAV